jgi:hypothetical protein
MEKRFATMQSGFGSDQESLPFRHEIIFAKSPIDHSVSLPSERNLDVAMTGSTNQGKFLYPIGRRHATE